MKIAHLTSVHVRTDTRIVVKECRGLAACGHLVILIVADGLGGGELDGVTIADAGKSSGRLDRIFRITRVIFKMAMELSADCYHLHDPELLPIGLLLKRFGKKVIFDSHEDVPKQILGKPYLAPVTSWAMSRCFAIFEGYACARLDGIIAATPFIRDKFLGINTNCVDVKNFPIVGELEVNGSWSERKPEACYVGAIGAIRGIREIVRALEHVRSGARLNLGGRFAEPTLEAEVKSYASWGRVNELGYLDREGVRQTLGRSMVGLVTLHPTLNYLDSLPVKMFEYMAAGIPVVASDFPYWREIIESSQCGICVDPLDPQAIAAAIDRLVEDPDLARRFGENGRAAVIDRYNWAAEERKLLAFYRKVMEME